MNVAESLTATDVNSMFASDFVFEFSPFFISVLLESNFGFILFEEFEVFNKLLEEGCS